MRETRELAQFIAAAKYEDLPPDLLIQAKLFVLDNFASGLVGSVQGCSKMVAELIRDARSKEECTLFGQTWRTNPSGAALVNGAMIEALEANHGYGPGSNHPSGAVFPAVMAVAEREHKDGKSFLTAMVLGYEALCRIGYAATRAVEDERGYHGPGSNAAFGAATGVGKLLGFDELTLTNALGIAGSHAAGLYEFAWEGAMTKRLHVARGSQMGLESALLAGKGFTGPTTVLEGKCGFFNVFSPSPKPERLLADLGKTWLIKGMLVKPFAVHASQLSIVQGLVDFLSGHPLDPKDIRRVVVTASGRMIKKHNDREPTSIMGAQFNMPFVVAVALTKDISNPLVFNEQTLWDPEVRELAKRVETVVDQPRFGETDPAAEVIIEVGGNREIINIGVYKGSPKRPFSFDEICDKFRRYSIQFIGRERAENIIEKVTNIEQVPDMAELARLMGV